jgi:hypothetical protein
MNDPVPVLLVLDSDEAFRSFLEWLRARETAHSVSLRVANDLAWEA